MNKKQRKIKKLYPKVYKLFVIGKNLTQAQIEANVITISNRTDSYLEQLEKAL